VTVAAVAGSFALGAGATAGATRYVFATFKGDTAPGEALSIYTSTDATNFTLLADTGFTGTSGTLRDPSIMRYVDGRYYVAYTDPPTSSCCGKEDHFSIAFSADLVHWTDLTRVPAGVVGVAHTWAPEWFVDGATVRVIANIDTLNNDTDFKPYVFTAQNAALTAWSGPVPLGFGPNYIDTFVMKDRGVYHAFAKNETTRFCEHATANSLTGPWTFVGTGNWAGWGAGMEGPNVVRLDDGSWKIFLDGQGAVGFLQAASTNLSLWSGTSPLPVVSNLVRHGTVIRDEPVGSGNGDGGTADGQRMDATIGPASDASSDHGVGSGMPDAPPTLDGSGGAATGGAGGGATAGTGGAAGSSGATGSQGGMPMLSDGGSPSARGDGAGCACGTGGRPGESAAALGVLLLLLARKRRRTSLQFVSSED
jgi:MYXO-CTERM domain-containing protein